MGPCLPLVMPVSPRSFAGFAQQYSRAVSCASAVLFVLSGKQPRGMGRGAGGAVAVGSLQTIASKCVVAMEKTQC